MHTKGNEVDLERDKSVISGSTNLEHLHTFHDFPVFMGSTQQSLADDIFAPQSWSICRDSGVIQLDQLLPLDVLYPESHGAGQVGSLWQHHHADFAAFVNGAKPSAVFEIGGSHGILEVQHQKFGRIPWTILEPNPHPSPLTNADFIVGFFDSDFSFTGPFDAVVHSHLFEHVYEPVSFMKDLERFIPVGKDLLFSVPNMMEMLKRKYANSLNFEHTFLLTEPYVEYLLSSHGFRLKRKQYFRDDHSIFFHAVREDVSALPIPGGLYELHRQLFEDFLEFHRSLVDGLNDKVRRHREQAYVFGAHVFTQYLLAFGLDTTNIRGALDNDPHKQGKRLYGSGLEILAPTVLRGARKPAVILRAGVYSEEIQRDLVENHNNEIVFFS